MIPYGKQDIVQADIDAVVEVLNSDFLTQGPKVPLFEEVVCEKVGAKFGVAVNSATSALHIACLALGLGKGDWLWTTPITFVASANCGLYCGAKVDFVDIDPVTYNMCPQALERKLELAKLNSKLPKVLVVVHLSGQPCNMEAIFELSKRFGFKVIEDASHAIGAKYKGEYVGNCQYSDVTVFSFHPVKIVTTAEGGLAVTNNQSLANRMNLYRSHGVTRSPDLMTHEPDGLWYYQQIELGFNYRMTEIQAALGISQMERLDGFIERRHVLAKRYNQLLEDHAVIVPWQHGDSYSAYHLYIIRLRSGRISTSHKRVFEELRSCGIGVNLHYIPIHLQPFYKKMDFCEGDFPESEQYYSEAISLPMYPALTIEQQDRVITALGAILDV